MNIFKTLSDTLLNQEFEEVQNTLVSLDDYKKLAYLYSKIENSIAVLSDMKSNESYIYYGKIAAELGMYEKDMVDSISSIWEEDIFNKIHPDDLLQKHIQELRYFNLLKSMQVDERFDYYVSSLIRMQNRKKEYVPMRHRMFYVSNLVNGDLWLALCLYNFEIRKSDIIVPENMIINSVTGEVIHLNQKHSNVLSIREREVLKFIRDGKMSKEIADLLSISINTVNRHRQNILEKLRVDNSIEACRIAERMNLF